ncbi:undecaprenyl phosphate N,N'-diacetylbacillosamine 1-phosphate transferase [Clostridia bacterium]|nr:undecaprenyl phosphate N,N'-diacetylbacillosamine 1-phosphate transferase [Clostridia bacterium]
MIKTRALQLGLKRIFDIGFTIVTCWVTIPVCLIMACVIKACSPEDPVVFVQKRIGLYGAVLSIHKLRTMTNERDDAGNLLPDELRIKRWGRIIRAMNADEMPQAWDILRGAMSWIGPRPLLPYEMSVMSEREQKERQVMRPGITGWEAINEAMAPTRRLMAECDLYYVRNWSLWLDIKIFFRTAAIVLLRLRPNDALRAPKMDDVSKTDGTGFSK